MACILMNVVWSDRQTTAAWNKYRSQSLSAFLACLAIVALDQSAAEVLRQAICLGLACCCVCLFHLRQIRLESRLSPPPAHLAQTDHPAQVASLAQAAPSAYGQLLQLTDSSPSSSTSSSSGSFSGSGSSSSSWVALLQLTDSSSSSDTSSGSDSFSDSQTAPPAQTTPLAQGFSPGWMVSETCMHL